MSRSVRIVVVYAAFAAIATAVNLAAQWVAVRFIHWLAPWWLHGVVLAALVVGTGAGLVVKYVLDKRFIFEDHTTGAATHARKFGLYSMMGLLTTVIFWASELLATRVSADPNAMYIGGALGLLVGYVIKYQLDKRFVFSPRAAA